MVNLLLHFDHGVRHGLNMVFQLLILTNHLLVISDADVLHQFLNFIVKFLVFNFIFTNLSFALNHDTKVLRGPF
jgi:hypothetical protein